MGQEVDYNKKKDQIANGLLWILAVCVIGVGAISWIVAKKLGYELPQDFKDWGGIGDFVGGLSNPLISTFTFFALLLTIIQNQKIIGINEAELRETRKEIELTREANEAQAIEFKVQNEITKNQAEIQTTTEAVLKASDLVNNIWKGPTSVPIHRAEADGSVRTQYLTLKECSAPWFDLDLDESFFKSVESTISEIIKLLVLHKKLLLRLEAISPNNSMVITVSLLVKAPIEWLEEHKAFDRHLYEESTLELLNFYKDNWHNKQTIEVR